MSHAELPSRANALWLIFVLAPLAVLTPFSFYVVFTGAHDEPYGVFHYGDAFVQVVVATLLITLWAVWIVGVAIICIAGRLHPLWLLTVVWGIACSFYLCSSPTGYLYDLEHYMLP